MLSYKLLILSLLSIKSVVAQPGHDWALLRATDKEAAIDAYLRVIDGVFVSVPDTYGHLAALYPAPPVGELHVIDQTGQGYLMPVEVENGHGLYDFRFGEVPLLPTVNFTDFADSSGRFVYDKTPEDDNFGGIWLAKLRDGGDGSATIHYFNWGGKVPEGYVEVDILWE